MSASRPYSIVSSVNDAPLSVMNLVSLAIESMAKLNGRGRRFSLIDTGGIVPDDEAVIPSNILKTGRVSQSTTASFVALGRRRPKGNYTTR
jgi:hypothetical protein